MLETVQRAFADRPSPLLSYGLPFAEALPRHVHETFAASRVYAIVSRGLAAQSDVVQQVQGALGADIIGGARIGMRPHTLWSEVLEIVAEARSSNADLLLVIGGGTLTDAAKVVSLALANDASTASDLATLSDSPQQRPLSTIRPPTIPIISIPTSLSAAEYSNLAGATDDATSHKHVYGPPLEGPRLVILDPALATTTPMNIWLSSGFRAVDHCVETYCSLINTTDKSDALAMKALGVLVPGLLRLKHNPGDLATRLQCQLASIDAVASITLPKGKAVELGGSHGIGHQLGPLGVGHGDTSCILLPAVCRYNASQNANSAHQERLRDWLMSLPVVAETLQRRSVGQGQGAPDLHVVLDAVIRELGLPRSLGDVNVGRDALDMLAENSLKDWCCGTNPAPLMEKGQVLEILEMVI
ncbi:hypothetical protein NW759_014994 [Fusarium solani]|nr:hypothetical protein NW759_014994 [Fusarium solani]